MAAAKADVAEKEKEREYQERKEAAARRMEEESIRGRLKKLNTTVKSSLGLGPPVTKTATVAVDTDPYVVGTLGKGPAIKVTTVKQRYNKVDNLLTSHNVFYDSDEERNDIIYGSLHHQKSMRVRMKEIMTARSDRLQEHEVMRSKTETEEGGLLYHHATQHVHHHHSYLLSKVTATTKLNNEMSCKELTEEDLAEIKKRDNFAKAVFMGHLRRHRSCNDLLVESMASEEIKLSIPSANKNPFKVLTSAANLSISSKAIMDMQQGGWDDDVLGKAALDTRTDPFTSEKVLTTMMIMGNKSMTQDQAKQRARQFQSDRESARLRRRQSFPSTDNVYWKENRLSRGVI
jgi:hypothetical protein